MIAFLKPGGVAPAPVRLEAPRIYLRPPRPADWKAWAALREASRAFLKPWEPTWPSDALDRGAFGRRLRRQAGEWRSDEGYSFLVFRKHDDALLGGIGITNVRRGVAQMASIGYWVGGPYARNGFMTEAVRATVDFAIGELNLHRVEAACIPANTASRGLLKKVGFVQEGVARAYLKIDGEWQDHLLFALVREDLGK